MYRDTWIPLLLAVVFQGFSAIIALGLPETLPVADFEPSNDVCNTCPVATSSQETDEQSMLDSTWVNWFRQTEKSFGFVTRDRAVSALVFTFLVSKVGRQANNVLFQYVSKRYGWTLSQASIRP
jgi:hypothetical protein